MGDSARGDGDRWPEHIDHVWCYDFIHDQTVEEHPLRFPTIVDEYTPGQPGHRGGPQDDQPGGDRDAEVSVSGYAGLREYIRSDNGPELIAHRLRRWLRECGVGTPYIDPGAPWEKGFGESLNARFCDELLNGELFASEEEVRVVSKEHLLEFNHHRL